MANQSGHPPLTAYAQSLGIQIIAADDALPILALPHASLTEGRPGAFHGGATCGLLEAAGYAALRAELGRIGSDPQLKPISITVQFLSAGLDKTSHAQGRITRLGRRNANVTVEAWQDDRNRPIASAVMNILMADSETSKG